MSECSKDDHFYDGTSPPRRFANRSNTVKLAFISNGKIVEDSTNNKSESA